jgi:N-methylhydantoinase A/oxoprolinase/acetone carboxylase beta subunit
VEKLRLRASRAPRVKNLAKPHGFTETYFAGKKIHTAIYRRAEVKPGSRLRSPCIVTEYSATTLVPAGFSGTADLYGNLVISVGT